MCAMKRFPTVGVAAITSCIVLSIVIRQPSSSVFIDYRRHRRRQQIIKEEEIQPKHDDQSQSPRRLVNPRRMTGRRLQVNDTISQIASLNEDAPSRLNDEQKKERIKAFLGGIYPDLDEENLPKYLRDTPPRYLRDSLPRQKLSFMDVWVLKKEVIFYWHIPKASLRRGGTGCNLFPLS